MSLTSASLASDIAKTAREPSSESLVTFFAGGLLFGIDILSVQEVLGTQPITAVPRAPEAVEGLINLRGRIVTVIDLRRRLRLAPRTPASQAMHVVIRTGEGGDASLLVDEAGGVIEVADAGFEQPPEHLAACARELIRGVYKLENALLLALDTRKPWLAAG